MLFVVGLFCVCMFVLLWCSCFVFVCVVWYCDVFVLVVLWWFCCCWCGVVLCDVLWFSSVRFVVSCFVYCCVVFGFGLLCCVSVVCALVYLWCCVCVGRF